jgi:Zn-dependent membrane protease YugP
MKQCFIADEYCVALKTGFIALTYIIGLALFDTSVCTSVCVTPVSFDGTKRHTKIIVVLPQSSILSAK